MASSSAVPTYCISCGKLPEFNKQGYTRDVWTYDTYKRGNKIIWFTLCPECARKEKDEESV